jgi:hypothetical protein
MTRFDGRITSRIRSNGSIPLRVVRLARQQPEGGHTRSSKTDLQLNSTTRREGRLSSPALERTELMVGQGANCIREGHLSRHQQDGKSRRVIGDRML